MFDEYREKADKLLKELRMNPEDNEYRHDMTDEEHVSLRNLIENKIKCFTDERRIVVVTGEIPWKNFGSLSVSTCMLVSDNKGYNFEHGCYIEYPNLCIPEMVGKFKECVLNKKSFIAFTTHVDLVPILKNLANFNGYGFWYIHRAHDKSIISSDEGMELLFKCSNCSIDFCDAMCAKDFCFQPDPVETPKEENNGTEGNC